MAGNWKMYKTPGEAEAAAHRLVELLSDVTDVDMMIAPTYPALVPVHRILAGSPIALGAQNMHWEDEGAYTGEVSAAMIKDAGCTYVIAGHSERRQYFGETDETVNRKVCKALAEGLIPVLCVGETQEEREAGNTFKVLDTQVVNGLKDVLLDDGAKLVVAYEPVWAIGTGLTATPEQAQEGHAYIREKLGGLYGKDLAKSIRVLYGGSVKPANVAELMAQPDLDGALVGGASLDPESFEKLVQYK